MIIKRKHSGSYAIIPNATADDEKLSADALGALVYLLAKPGDWKVIVADLRRRFSLGKDRAYSILKELENVGYVKRFQNRGAGHKFATYEYVIYDGPEAMAQDAGLDGREPLPENQEAVKTQQNPASGFTGYGGTASGKSGHILSTKSTNSLRRENSAEAGAETPQEGFEEKKPPIVETPSIGGQRPIGEISPLSGLTAPSINQEVWKEGYDLLKTTSPNPNRSIIGKWLKRSSTKKDGKEKLLGMIRAAVKAGTLEPVAYIAKAVDREFGPLPQPKKFDTATWQRNILAAIKTKDWPQAWGPLPGMKGCLIPTELITPEFTTAMAGRMAA